MSPRRGGEADKFGNRYEGRWTVRHLLYVLLGRVESVTVEQVGDIGKGVEFSVRRGDVTEVHQVKRQVGNANEWSLQALASAGVLRAARDHVTAGREFHFVSTVPARVLDELTDRARRSATAQVFIDQMLTKQTQPDFNYLAGDGVLGSVDAAWQTLRGMYVRWPDERELVDGNSAIAGVLLSGAEPLLAAAGLGELVLDRLNIALDANLIERLLPTYGLSRAGLFGNPTLVESVRAASERWRDSVGRELLQPAITRTDAADVWDLLQGGDRTLFVVGAAGAGKSAVLHETVREAESAGWPVLAFRLDRLEATTSPGGLGRQLDLDISPVSALAAISQT